ncbi:MAG: TonB-dependent receptor [Vicinamibacteraceae bacterium]
MPRRSPSRSVVAGSLLLLLLGAAPAPAQDTRGTITGTVADKSAAVLPGVTVGAVNVETGIVTSAVSNGEGIYLLPFLTPGKYTVTAELMGFKKYVREGLELRIADRITLDLSLDVGQMAEVVSVHAESPLLDVTSGSQGQVIDERRISLLPLSDGNAFTLARLAPGIAYTGDLKFSRPFDNAGTSGIVSDGAAGGNEFTLDGTPNMASGRRVAYVPPAGAVAEFKVETASFDAQQGHTAGATVNVAIKSGTNNLKGEGYWYYRDDKLSKNDFFLQKAGRPKAEMSYDRFGGFAGGPILKNRTFFFGAVEWLYDEFPEPGQFTVPTERMRNGDFSELLTAGITIYDPATAVRRADGRIERQPFPGNVIPAGRISPIARNYLQYWPLPNQAADAQQQNNFLSSNPRTDDFYSVSLRADHRLSDRQSLFVRYTRNDRQEARGNWAGEVGGIRPIGNYLFRVNDGVTGDHVWTITPRSLLNVRAGWQRFREPNVRQHEGAFDLASLGFPSSTVSQFGATQYLPRFEIGGVSVIGENVGGTTEHSIYSFQPTFTRMAGRHTFRGGYDFRIYQEVGAGPGRSAGQYDFGTNYTRQLDNSPAANTGQQLAAFLLGQPTGGSIERNTDRENWSQYHGIWFQDDWRVSDRLTLNMGLRYDYESATYESQNRNVRGFDPNATLAVEAAAEAAYARNPIAELPASAFDVRGGLTFAGDGERGFWNADANNWQPRFGLAYQINSKTVARGGFGVYTSPFVIAGVRQSGFSQSTNIVPTLDNGLTFGATLATPFPNGVQDPLGSSLGPNTFVGRQLDRFAYLDGVRNEQNARWAITVQRELPKQWLLELGYVGSRGFDLILEQNDNTLPRQYLSTAPSRDQTAINTLTANVPNPFAGLLPGEGLNGSTTQRQQLLRPFPQYQDIQTWRYDGSSRYHALQSRLERRFSQGYTVLFAYTYSKYTDRNYRLNFTDDEPAEAAADADVPHRFAFSGILELPFGRGRRWGSDANGVVNALVGDWTVTAIASIQSGRPISFTDRNRNLYFAGDPNALSASYSDDIDQPVFDISGFYFADAAVQTNGAVDPTKQRNDQRIRLANNVRYFPHRIDTLRSQALNEWQMSFVKRVAFTSRVRGQINIELLNAFNQTIFTAPNADPTNANFGKVTSQFNLPQSVQLAFKLLF